MRKWLLESKDIFSFMNEEQYRMAATAQPLGWPTHIFQRRRMKFSQTEKLLLGDVEFIFLMFS